MPKLNVDEIAFSITRQALLDKTNGKELVMKKEACELLDISGESLRKKLKHGELREDCCGRISISCIAMDMCQR